MIFTFSNQKGGDGKTSLAYNIAARYASNGKKVLVIDGDPQGNLTKSFIEGEPTCETLLLFNEGNLETEPEKITKNLSLIGTTKDLSIIEERDFEVIYLFRENVLKIADKYDYIFIDAPPSLSKLSISILSATKYVIIPVNASPYSVMGVVETLKLVQKVRKRINNELELFGIIFNKLKPRVKFYHEMVHAVEDIEHHMIFDTVINDSIRFPEASSKRMPVFEYAPKSKSAEQISAFQKEIEKRLKKFKKS